MAAPELEASPGPAPRTDGAAALLCAVFALSGAAALVFETLFFRLAGLALGNSVQAASIVLFSFMTGLGLGNALAARLLHRVGRPLRLFAALEVGVAASGGALVWLFPELSRALVPAFRPLLDAGVALGVARLAAAFALFVAPAIAMGMTLPVLVAALHHREPNLGSALGRLYGWNTAGAVAGALLAERVLVTGLGVRGAGATAAGLDLLAALGVLWLRRRRLPDRLPARPAAAPVTAGPDRAQLALLAAAFLCGGILLALEVVWFRFFLLFTPALAWNLALMLATVLAGISAGGLAAARLCRLRPAAPGGAAGWIAAAGAGVSLLYAALAALWPRIPQASPVDAFVLLMFPVSFLSGAIFTLLGAALEARGLAPEVATGRLALANTAGSALGSLLGGFVLIPRLGIEAAFLWLALAYGATALLAVAGRRLSGGAPARGRLAAAAVLYLVALAFFPRGALPALLGKPGSVRAHLEERGYELVAFREAVTETLQYFGKSVFGEPLHTLLVTNDHPMAGTPVSNRRYMKAYVYWPIAINPDARSALLISYGVGATARALADTRSLASIDVVDVSAAVLEMSEVVHPGGGRALDDPRVRVHVEDGRFFLATTGRRFDLITGEPPPPRHAGVANLYSREYFELVRGRLRPGGVVSYWLSVHQLRLDESRAVLRGFCDVFEHCSLWSGNGLEWMMLAVVEPPGPPPASAFARQWREPALQPELRTLGFPDPGSLGAVFIADGERLRDWIGATPPLVDDFPQRIASRPYRPDPEALRAYHAFMGDPAAQTGFLTSRDLARYWPDAWRRPDPIRARRSRFLLTELWREPPYARLWATLRQPELAGFLPWVLGSDADAAGIAGRAWRRDPTLHERDLPAGDYAHLAAAALAEGDLERAERVLARWQARGGSPSLPQLDPQGLTHLRVTLRLAAGEPGRAAELMQRPPPGSEARRQRFRAWLAETLGAPGRGLGG